MLIYTSTIGQKNYTSICLLMQKLVKTLTGSLRLGQKKTAPLPETEMRER